MAVEVFHNLRRLTDSSEYANLVAFDKFIVVRRGKSRHNLFDIFGVRENVPDMRFLMTFDDRSRERVTTIATASGLSPLEVEYLWNLADSYSFAYADIQRDYFNYQTGELADDENLDSLDLLRQVARFGSEEVF